MMRRLYEAIGAAAIGAALACGSDQLTNTTPPPPPPGPALALHFDTLAGALAPGDIRLVWYQDIASILALGINPTSLSAHFEGLPAVFQSAIEVDAFADTLHGKIADSSYRLAAWAPPERPAYFIDLRVRFVRVGAGKPDTAVTYLVAYTDTLGAALVDSTEQVVLQVLSNRGSCVATALAHLTVPTNPCTRVTADWTVGAGTGLFVISPAAQISGTHLTH